MLSLVVSNGIQVGHIWIEECKGTCSSCQDGIDCISYSIGAARCETCYQENISYSTTHCPGNLYDLLGLYQSDTRKVNYAFNLLLTLIEYGSLNYQYGKWFWPEDEVYIDRKTHRSCIIQHAGSIDRYISYADKRCEEQRQRSTANW